MNNNKEKNNLENFVDKYYKFNIVEPFMDTSSFGLPVKMMFSCVGVIALLLFIYRLITDKIEGGTTPKVIEFLIVCCGGCCCAHPYYIMYCIYQMTRSNQSYQGDGDQYYQGNQGYR
jgi:hypothetical protein